MHTTIYLLNYQFLLLDLKMLSLSLSLYFIYHQRQEKLQGEVEFVHLHTAVPNLISSAA